MPTSVTSEKVCSFVTTIFRPDQNYSWDSFYPIFPVPDGLSSEVNLDVTHSDGAQMIDEETDLDYAPDVLILPSRLKQFSKVGV